MKLVIDGRQLDVPDTLLEENGKKLFDFLLDKYRELPIQYKVAAQGVARAILMKVHVTPEKGADPIESLLNVIKPQIPESFKDVELSLTTSQQDNTLTATDFKLNVSSEGKSW